MREEVAGLLRGPLRRGRLVFRGDDERRFLAQWLQTPSAQSRTPEIEQSIEDVIRTCTACGKVSGRKFGVGTGSSGVMVILNPPGMLTELEKKVYRADSVELLKKMVAALGLDISQCYLTSLVKCETVDSLTRPGQVVANCLSVLVREIEVYRPEIVLVLGDLTPLHRTIKQSRGISWHNAEHPITLLKNPELKRKAWESLKVVIEKLGER